MFNADFQEGKNNGFCPKALFFYEAQGMRLIVGRLHGDHVGAGRQVGYFHAETIESIRGIYLLPAQQPAPHIHDRKIERHPSCTAYVQVEESIYNRVGFDADEFDPLVGIDQYHEVAVADLSIG